MEIVVAERTGNAGLQSGGLSGVKHMKQLLSKTGDPCHRDHVVHHRHPGSFRRLRFAGEIVFDQSGKASGDSRQFAFPFDRHLPQLTLLDGVFLRRPLVERPEKLVEMPASATWHSPTRSIRRGCRCGVLRRRIGRACGRRLHRRDDPVDALALRKSRGANLDRQTRSKFCDAVNIYTSNPVRPSDCADFIARLILQRQTPIPSRLLRWMRS